MSIKSKRLDCHSLKNGIFTCFTSIAFSALMLQGCDVAGIGKENEMPGTVEEFSIKVEIGCDSAATEPPFKTAWHSDDAISVISKSQDGFGTHKFTSISPKDDTFGCEGFTPDGVMAYYLIYPYQEGLTELSEDGFISNPINIAADVPSALLCGSVAVSEKEPTVSLHHCQTFFEVKVLNVSDADIEISSIRLANGEEAPMSGTFFINPESGELEPFQVESETILNDVGGLVAHGETASFYLASAPFSLTGEGRLSVGLTVNGEEKVFEVPTDGNMDFLPGAVNPVAVSYPVPLGAVTGITLDRNELQWDFSINPDSRPETLTATVTPNNADDMTLIWTSSDPLVAEVSQDGTVTPVGHGRTVITAVANDGYGAMAECVVTVIGVKDRNFGKGNSHYDRIYYPINVEVVLPDGEKVVQTWLDRNLGASEVASQTNAPNGYGSLFQWSRKADGHEIVSWDSPQKGHYLNRETAADRRASDRENPESDKFIYVTKGSHYDWAEDERSDMEGLWGGAFKWGGADQEHASPLDDESQANNPCPKGYRLPSAQELYLMVGAMAGKEVLDDTKSQIDGIAEKLLNSQMHIPTPGFGNEDTGNISYIGNYCVLWCNTPGAAKDGKYETARRVFFSAKMTSNNFQTGTYRRARGGSVRCIRAAALDDIKF